MAANIGELKNLVAAFFQRTVSDFTMNGIDMLLYAANNARRKAELLNQFTSNQDVASVSVGPNGGSLSSAVLDSDGSTQVRVKDYDTFYIASPDDNGALIPLYHHSKKNIAIWAQEKTWNARARFNELEIRYPSDEFSRNLGRNRQSIYIHGDKINFDPPRVDTVTVKVDGYFWMSEYIADADSDWMVINCSEYLQWAMICELNFFTATFTANQDGNVGPPERQRKDAYDAMVLWDQSQIHRGRNPMGMR